MADLSGKVRILVVTEKPCCEHDPLAKEIVGVIKSEFGERHRETKGAGYPI